MPLLIEDVPLLLPTTELLEAASSALPFHQDDLWVSPCPGPLAYKVWTREVPRLPRPDRFQEFHWPVWGVSRWAFGHFLASADQAQAIRERAFGTSGSESNPVTLRLWAVDPVHNAGGENAQFSGIVDHVVYVLPPKPLVRGRPYAEASRGLYLLTVVDLRWFLQGIAVPEDLTIDSNTTWVDLYDDLAGALGIDLTFEPTPKDVQFPHHSLTELRHESAVAMLDAAASSAGHRIVANRDGTFHAHTPAFSASIRSAADASLDRARLAGGEIGQAIL